MTDLARDLEVRTAERDRALNALRHLERILTQTGGFLAPLDQAALFEARAVLAEAGRIPAGQRAPWVDRVPCRGCGVPSAGVCGSCDEIRRRLQSTPGL